MEERRKRSNILQYSFHRGLPGRERKRVKMGIDRESKEKQAAEERKLPSLANEFKNWSNHSKIKRGSEKSKKQLHKRVEIV